MKLVYLAYSLARVGGMEMMLSQKAGYLSDVLGYDVTIITSRQKGRGNFFPLSPSVKQMDIGINYHCGAYRRALSKLLCTLRPDVTVSFCGGELDGLAGIPDGSVKVAEFHFSHDRFYYRDGHGLLHDLVARIRTERLERRVSEMASFVVLTDQDKAVWESRLGRKVMKISNFISFRPAASASLDAHRCISVGRFCESKNHDELIRAWAIVSRRHPDWTLDIYGRGHRAAKLRKLIKSLGLNGKVNIHGPESNIKAELEASSIMLFTSLNEGLPLTLLEASAVGLPSISYDCPCGPREIIVDGLTGYLVGPHNVEEFAGRVCELIEDEDLRKKMGAAAAESCSRFGKDEIMQEWDAFFRSLVPAYDATLR